MIAGCPFCDWTEEGDERDTFGGRLGALMRGVDHALEAHPELVGGGES